jgi:deoxyribodipyrimidine photo-lyase
MSLHHFSENCPPSPNDKGCRLSKKFAPLFDTPIPEKLEGFELEADDKMKMREVWPAGEDMALKVGFLSSYYATLVC